MIFEKKTSLPPPFNHDNDIVTDNIVTDNITKIIYEYKAIHELQKKIIKLTAKQEYKLAFLKAENIDKNTIRINYFKLKNIVNRTFHTDNNFYDFQFIEYQSPKKVNSFTPSERLLKKSLLFTDFMIFSNKEI